MTKQERKIYNKKYHESHINESKEYRRLHKKESISAVKKYRETHKQEISIQRKKYYELHKEEFKNYTRKYSKLTNYKAIKKYYKTHKEDINKKRKEYNSIQRKTNISYKIRHNLAGRILDALKENTKSANTEVLLGCSVEFFRKYYELKFTEGMSWEKVMTGEIHCDHIRPCASFDLSKPEEQIKCFHYTNLQPLWAVDNLKKSNNFN